MISPVTSQWWLVQSVAASAISSGAAVSNGVVHCNGAVSSGSTEW